MVPFPLHINKLFINAILGCSTNTHNSRSKLCSIHYVQPIKCNDLPKMEGQIFTFFNIIVLIYFTNLNLIKMGNTPPNLCFNSTLNKNNFLIMCWWQFHQNLSTLIVTLWQNITRIIMSMIGFVVINDHHNYMWL